MAAFRGLAIPPLFTPPFVAAFSAFPPQFFAAQALPITPVGVAAMNAAASQAILSAAALGVPFSPASLYSYQFLTDGFNTGVNQFTPFGFSSMAYNPFTAAAVNPALLGYASNPFTLATYPSYAPYNTMMASYGGGSYGGGAMMSPAAASRTAAANYVNELRASKQESAESPNVLTAFGVPNRDGRLEWPLGLRVLAPAADANKLREQIDTLAAMLVAQKTMYGQVDASLVQELNQAIDRLRSQLAARSTDLPQVTYNDAWGFLRKLQDAAKAMR